jgi:CheY-like chemotaxis protein
MLGWTVLSQLKQDPAMRHIPVQIATLDEDRHHGLSRGAFSFVKKTSTKYDLEDAFARIKDYAGRSRKRLLLVDDDMSERTAVTELLSHSDLEITAVDTGAEALRRLRAEPVDCLVLDLKLPDMSGFEVLEQICEDADLRDVPVVVFTGRELSAEEDAQLRAMARSVVVKGVESPERLLDETALLLHRIVAELPPAKRRMLQRLHSSDEALVQRTDVAIVLMDIMMPGMDGYETIQAIRAKSDFLRLPILALTAKAMKGDREKCLESGASDYLAKPVNIEQLLSALRMWLHR